MKNIKEYIIKYNLGHILPENCINILQLHYFNTDQYIVQESTPVKYLYILVKGKCRISPTSEDGKVALLDFVLTMDVIGDLEYFSKDLYYYNVVALSPCVALSIPVNLIEEYFSSNVNFYKFLCENMSSKMKRTSLKYSKTLLYPIKNQIANYFYDLFIEKKSTILPIQFKETAEFFDITPRYFRSILVELESEGILSRETNGIKLMNLGKLQKYAISKSI